MQMSDARKLLEKLQKGKHKIDVTMLSDSTSPCVVSEWLSTGCVVLDKALGGGLPVGRITECYGDTSTGKSLIAGQVAAMAQQDGHIVVYMDTEHAASLPIMKAVGVNMDELIYHAPDTIEECFTMMKDAIDYKHDVAPNALMLLIWDSIAASATQFELDNEFGKASMGRGAQLLSAGLRKIKGDLARNRVCTLLLNQTREKIGIMFGDNETTYGGKAVEFYASIRIRLKKGQKIKDAKKIIGLSTRASVVKNKVAPPFLGCELPVYFGHGIDDAEASFLYLKDAGLITGTTHKHITIGGKDETFTGQSWAELYDANFDAIAEIIMAFDAPSEDVEDVEPTATE
jgi:recombination protein RecA